MASDVRLDNVTKHFGDFRAVDDVSLNIAAGSFAALLGASGAGKSTVLRLIGGFEQPDAGSVRIGGTDVTRRPPYRRDVNTVFQHYALFPHMSVAENVAFGLRQDAVKRSERRARVRDALDMVRLAALAHRKPSQLSGGQQQRVALARALVKRPSVLLLDEPLAALDRKLRQQMQVELKLLQHELGLTFIFVTHDQEEALAMSDSIAVMRDGRVEQVGSPADLYDRPRNAYVANFIGSQNFLAGRLLDGGTRLHADCGILLEAAAATDGLAAGAAAIGTVRPENVQLARDEPAQSANKAHGVIATVVMLGDALDIMVRLDAGPGMFSRASRRRDDSFAAGDQVWAHWSADATRFFPFDESVMREREASTRIGQPATAKA